MTEEEKNNDITNPLKNGRMTAKEFWIRFSAWLSLSVISPVTFIGVKYKIFSSNDQPYKLTGWGIIALLIVAVFLIVAAKEAMRGLPKGSMLRQCIVGYIRLMPLMVLLLIVNAIKNSIEAFQQFLTFFIATEAAAVPVNPFPKWSAQNEYDMSESSMLSAFSRAFALYHNSKAGGK